MIFHLPYWCYNDRLYRLSINIETNLILGIFRLFHLWAVFLPSLSFFFSFFVFRRCICIIHTTATIVTIYAITNHIEIYEERRRDAIDNLCIRIDSVLLHTRAHEFIGYKRELAINLHDVVYLTYQQLRKKKKEQETTLCNSQVTYFIMALRMAARNYRGYARDLLSLINFSPCIFF